MFITETLKLENVYLGCTVNNKADALKFMCNVASRNNPFPTENILSLLLEKEKILSSGLKDGIAIPHIRDDILTKAAMSVVIFKEPIIWGTLDARPVTFVSLVIGPRRCTNYFWLLAKICKIIERSDFKEKIIAINSVEEVLKLLKENENQVKTY